MPGIGRRGFLLGGVALGVSACGSGMDMDQMRGGTVASGMGHPTAPVPPAPSITPRAGQRVVRRTLTPKPVAVDLGGVTAETWAFDGGVPGPLIRATAGDFVQVDVRNGLPAETTVHWHGIRLRNPADGLPGVTQDPIAPGAAYTYQFVPPDPGTYFFHPHVGLQLDHGLYAPLVIDDPHEPGAYDHEWVLVLDDWIDGSGSSPEQEFARLRAGGSGMAQMHHEMGPAPWGPGDVTYPYYLINGRVPTDPDVLRARPGDRVRLRIINASSDTIHSVAVGGHRMTITHTDGWAVVPQDVDSIYLGMGERYDALVTLGDGVFPVVARPFAKTGEAVALIRTGAGAPPASHDLPELADPFVGSRLRPADASRLPGRSVDQEVQVLLTGSMGTYNWSINGAPYGQNQPIEVHAGQRVRLSFSNMSMMTHPMHLHGHTFALPSGLRKDTVLIPSMGQIAVDFDTDNDGDWMLHCHNAYHGEAGMMIGLNYA